MAMCVRCARALFLYRRNIIGSPKSTTLNSFLLYSLGRPALSYTPQSRSCTMLKLPSFALSLQQARRGSLRSINPLAPSWSNPRSPSSARSFTTSSPLLGRKTTPKITHLKRKRQHGFLSRVKTRTGRMILKRRRQKGRIKMSH